MTVMRCILKCRYLKVVFGTSVANEEPLVMFRRHPGPSTRSSSNGLIAALIVTSAFLFSCAFTPDDYMRPKLDHTGVPLPCRCIIPRLNTVKCREMTLHTNSKHNNIIKSLQTIRLWRRLCCVWILFAYRRRWNKRQMTAFALLFMDW